MGQFFFINEQLHSDNSKTISYHQRGFLFGDGAFESCKIFNYKIINFDAHFQRLKKALIFLKIKADLSKIKEKSLELISANSCQNGTLRFSVTRGIGSQGYLPNDNCQPLIIIETKDYLVNNNPKIDLGISYRNPAGFFFKSHSALNYVLSKIEADENNFFDNILINDQGIVCETSSANIFWIKDGTIFTPADECKIVQGCIRDSILEFSNLKVVKTNSQLTDILNCDEVFITNANYILQQVTSINFNNKSIKYPISKESISSKIYQELIAKLSIL